MSKELFLVQIGGDALAVGTVAQAADLVKLISKMISVEWDWGEKDDAGNQMLRRRKDTECSIKGGYVLTTPRPKVNVTLVGRPALPSPERHGLDVDRPRLLPLSQRRLLP